MINNKFLLASFISVADTSALQVICVFIKINKILEIIKILNEFYNVVLSKELRAKGLGSAVDFSSSSFISLIFSFIFSNIFFSVIILVNSS